MAATVESLFEAIKVGNPDTVRDILLQNRALIGEKLKRSDAKFQDEIELDAYKFLGAYLGAISPLHFAIILGQDDIAKDIIERAFKDDLNQTLGGGNTALHLATLLGANDIVKLLLERGADCTINNGKGFTPKDLSDDPELAQAFNKTN